MKNLIVLNFAIGVLLTVDMLVFQKYEGVGLLAGIFLLPGFFALALANIAAIFFLWKTERRRAFIPIGT